jgi:hypothetical protein
MPRFGLRPLKTLDKQDDSTGMSSHKISPGDASILYQGSMAIGAATGYIDISAAASTKCWERSGEHSILIQQH